MARRVLVTGSRSWTDEYAVYYALVRELQQADDHHLIVVHGACPTGADAFAHRWATLVHFKPWVTVEAEPHPADWHRDCDENCYHRPREKNGRSYCPMAGHLRNQAMVDLGADVCLAFPTTTSRGTRDCMRRAEAAGIPIVVEHERTGRR
jgi:hypothetical protein